MEKMGKWVLRGPLEEREILLYRGITTTMASGGASFDQAVGSALEAMLQSPRFIYRIEDQQADGSVTLPDALAPYLGGKTSITVEGVLA